MIHTEIDQDGGRRVIKTATGTEADRLRHEAEVLATIDHPGVVELIGVDDDGDRFRLATAWIDGMNLAEEPPGSPVEVARTMAAVTRTLADLHQIGVIHGDLSAEHILVDTVGRVTLCGFSRALLPGARPEVVDLTPSVDDSGDRDPEANGVPWPGPAVDLSAAGALILQLEAGLTEATDGTRSPLLEDLRHLGELACESAGPAPAGFDFTMADLAHRLNQLCPRPSPDGAAANGARPALLHRLAVPAGLIVAGVLVVLLWPTGPIGARSVVGAALPPAPTVTTEAPPATTTIPAPAPEAEARPGVAATSPGLIASAAPPCPPPTPAMHRADIDGDGCPEGWYRTGGVLVADGVRYAIGDSDDLLTVGDWNCDGVATPALVTRPEGGVFLFPGWARESASITTAQVRTWADPGSVTTRPGPGCDTLVVIAASGTHEIGGRP